MKLIIEVHQSKKSACNAQEHFANNFNFSLFKEVAEIKVFNVNTSNEDKIVLITPNGDIREFEPLRLDVLEKTLITLTGLKIK